MSTPIITRADFQQLAEDRLREAKTLLDNQQWDGAYYLAGYSVELALKACIIKMLMTTDAFPDQNLIKNSYVHAVTTLLKTAKLEAALEADKQAAPLLRNHWEIVEVWNEAKRYQRISQAEAEGLYNAITESQHGVLSWIKRQW